ncbi:pseudouridine synthase [Earliella scabrosa]|nr:pseudouridine synthase [Earliella scabrosa]
MIVLTSRFPRSGRLRLSKPTWHRASTSCRTYRYPAEKALLYADRDMAVINKNSGILVQLTSPHARETSSVSAKMFWQLLDDVGEHLSLKRPLWPFHRLDKEATGALGLACSMQAAEDFGRQLSRPGQAEKTFLALVCADTFALKESSGIIRTELECRDGRVSISGGLPRYEGGYRRLKVMGKVREENWTKFAVTSYEVVARSPVAPLALLRLRVYTEHKYQLRVHMAQHLFAPILGDSLYMSRADPLVEEIKQSTRVPRRLFLHASRLSLLRHIPSEVRFTVGAPLPANFIEICRDTQIPLSVDDVMGGVWIDDTKVRGAKLTGEVDTDDAVGQLGGQWCGPVG